MFTTLLLLACTADKDDTAPESPPPDDSGDADTDSDADTDTDTDSDTDTDTDFTGTLWKLGVATADHKGYVGVETLTVKGDDDVIVCEIESVLQSTGSRDDCEDCEWAFDLVWSASTVVYDVAPGCLATTGWDASNVAGLDGTTMSYGYAPEYFGHAQVLMVEIEGVWSAVTFATWDEESLDFRYEWEEGTVSALAPPP